MRRDEADDGEVDEFGRSIAPRRSASPPRQARSGSRSRSRERRKQERRERRAEKKQRNDGEGERGPDREREEREYRRSLFPPGSDLSSYTFDDSLFWYVTADKVWWYRPDLCLWYDSRSGSYYSFDEAARDYVSVEAEMAVQSLADGKSCAPAAVAERRKVEEELRVKMEADDVLRQAAEAEVEALAKARAEAAEAAEAEEAAARAAEEDAAARTGAADSSGGASGIAVASGAPSGAARDGEDAVAERLQAHTESWQGKKDTQEDRYIQSVRLGRLGTVYGVFDGHGGVHAAEYVGKHLPKAVANCYQQRGGNGKKDRVDGKRLLAAMEDAFPITDRELLQQARRKGSKDGTTALLLLVAGAHVDDLTLFLSHVGDCRAVLCRGTSAVRLTQDHRPDRKDEQRRIREAGGGVLQVAGIWRCTDAKGAARAVDARAGFNEHDSNLYLSCSRTLGDPELKLNPDRPILSNLPDTSAHTVGKDDLMVVLACDGVWDVLSDQRAVDLALEHWGNPQAAAAAIVRKALSAGSPDNLTAQVVMFGWKGEQGAQAARRRADELMRQADEEAKPVNKPKVEEEDVDMFA